jgi:hypothetical protein
MASDDGFEPTIAAFREGIWEALQIDLELRVERCETHRGYDVVPGCGSVYYVPGLTFYPVPVLLVHCNHERQMRCSVAVAVLFAEFFEV